VSSQIPHLSSSTDEEDGSDEIDPRNVVNINIFEKALNRERSFARGSTN